MENEQRVEINNKNLWQEIGLEGIALTHGIKVKSSGCTGDTYSCTMQYGTRELELRYWAPAQYPAVATVELSRFDFNPKHNKENQTTILFKSAVDVIQNITSHSHRPVLFTVKTANQKLRQFLASSEKGGAVIDTWDTINNYENFIQYTKTFIPEENKNNNSTALS